VSTVPMLPLGGFLVHWIEASPKMDRKIQLCGSERDKRTPSKSKWTWWKWMQHPL